jgi:transposase
MYNLIQAAKLNDVDPQAYLADILSRIAETSQSGLSELLPWNWTTDRLSRVT